MSRRIFREFLASKSMRLVVYFANSLVFLMVVGLYLKSRPILKDHGLWELLSTSAWHPLRGEFGYFPFIIGTIEITLLAMVIAVPPCLLAAIYLAEFIRARHREALRIIIDLMAGIPSVVYGLFGVILIVPAVQKLGTFLGIRTTGYSLLAGGIILAVMVVPIITSVAVEVMLTVPMEARETTMALGTTRWEAVRHVVLKGARQGIISAIVLGFARAFGETIAVMMVVGNVPRVAKSLFDPAYPLPALIANNYGEVMSVPLYDSALMFAALVLLVVVGAFHLAAHLTLVRLERRS